MGEAIRRCVPGDAAAIAAIYDPIVSDTYLSFEETPPGAHEIERRIVAAGDRFPWLAFERAGSLVGYIYASPHRSREAYQWSVDVSVYVEPAAHRSGVATRLYAALFDLLEKQGYCAAFAGVALPNDASVRLHRAVGFCDVGTYHSVGFKLGQWHDVLWLERRLRPTDVAPLTIRTLAALASDDGPHEPNPTRAKPD